MTDYARYLRINPDTYRIKKEKLFDIETCQFCGEDWFSYQRCLPSTAPSSNYYKGIRWIQRCNNCKKTVSYAVLEENN